MSLRSLAFALLVASHLARLPAAVGQPLPTAPEFQVNTYTTFYQSYPAVAADAAGNFVVVWQSGSGATTIQAQRYDSTGAPAGDEFMVNTYGGYPVRPSVAAHAAGGFVVVWHSNGSPGTDRDFLSVQARRYDSSGTPLGNQFQVNSYTTSIQWYPDVATTPDGGFIVVWGGSGGTGTDTEPYTIQGQRFDAAGTPLGEFQVNSFTTASQYRPAVAVDGSGNSIVVWESYDGPGSDTHRTRVEGQRYDASGTPLGGEFQVNTYTTDYQNRPDVVMDAAGNFVVVWQTALDDIPLVFQSLSVHGQRYDAAGTPIGGEFDVETYTTGNQGPPAVAIDATGSFVVVWASYGSTESDTSGHSIQAQRFDAAGSPVGSQFQVNTYTTGFQRWADVTAWGAGSFVVVWQGAPSAGPDVNGSVQGQRYAVNPTTTTSSSTSTTTDVSTTTTSSTIPGTFLLPGRFAVVRDLAQAQFIARPIVPGGTFPLPTIDVVAEGGTLRFFDTGGGAGDDTYGLPAGGRWRALGNPPGSKGYRYRGAGNVPDPCKVVVIKERLVKGVCRSPGVTLRPPFTGAIGIVLSLGTTEQYCLRFGGTHVRNDGALTKRRDASAPGTCP
jgi:hypothetical protein